MAKAKTKKILFSLMAFIQIFSLTFGNFFVAQAVDIGNPEEATKKAFEEILGLLGMGEENAADGGSSANVQGNKGGQSVPSVSVMFSPSAPKQGEKATAIAIPMSFSNPKEQLYFTWFLKRKGCDTRPEKYDPDETNSYKADTYLSDTLKEAGDTRTPKECDLDGDNMVTVNDWKVDAGRAIAQNGFLPDIGAKYANRNDFYASNTDSDSYQAWQGGADAERVPAHCYVYHPTTGLNYELAKRPFNGTPMCPDPGDPKKKIPAICAKDITFTPTITGGDPCNCWEDSDSDGYDDAPVCYDCFDGGVNYLRTSEEARGMPLLPGEIDYLGDPVECTDAKYPSYYKCDDTYKDGIVQWWECFIEGGNMHCDVPDAPDNTYGEIGGSFDARGLPYHLDCKNVTEFSACKKENKTPVCGEISGTGKYAALCGEDANGDGLDDSVADGTAMCPTVVSDIDSSNETYFKGLSSAGFEALVSAGLSYASDEYVFMAYRGRTLEGYEDKKLPACTCEFIEKKAPATNPQRPNPGTPLTGPDSDPVCADRSVTENDLLCGSGKTVARGADDQFHLFPQKLQGSFDANEKYVADSGKSYYETTRTYSDSFADGDFAYKTGNTTGNDSFNQEEERFWGTDPRNPSTSGNGQADEANLAGMGMAEFSWTYEEGDEVGVAIEGTSTIATKFADSSRMIFWAFSQGVKSTTDKDKKDEAACQPKMAGTYEPPRLMPGAAQTPPSPPTPKLPPVPGKRKNVSIPVASIDFDKCLAASTIPIVAGGGMNGAQPKGMEVAFSVSPDNPMNDENGEGSGDTLNAQSIVTGAIGSDSDLTYNWKIEAFKPAVGPTKEPTERDWTSCGTNCLVCDKNATSGCPLNGEKGKLKMTGLGLKGISFKLDLAPSDATYGKLFNADGEGYFRISLEARENSNENDDLNSRVGRGSVVVKVTSNQNRITVFLPETTGGTLENSNNVICAEGEEKKVCPVIKNQIIGLTVPATRNGTAENFTDFNWFLNGKPINNCDTAISSLCANNKTTGFTFVPITDSGDKTFTVSVKASNVSGTTTGGVVGTGNKIELSRNFKVVEPSVKIVPAGSPVSGSGAWKKTLGTISDPTGTSPDVVDQSESILETATGNAVTLALAYTPANISTAVSGVSWQIDGVSTSSPQFTAGVIGTVHNVSASATYTQPTEVFAILKKFGVSLSEMKPQTLSHSVQIEVNKAAGAVSIKSPVRFLANLFSKIPEQILFFIRLFLSMGMMLVLVGAIFSFFPEVAYDERRRR